MQYRYYQRECIQRYPSFYQKNNSKKSKYNNSKMTIVQTTDSDFQTDVIASEIPVLVDFWAEWCGPCKMIGPILEDLSEKLSGKIKIVKVDVDKNSQTAIKYSIRSIPTLIIFEDGHVKAQHIGAASGSQIENFINNNT